MSKKTCPNKWLLTPTNFAVVIKPKETSSARYIYEGNRIIALVYNKYDAQHICDRINEHQTGVELESSPEK